MASLFDPEQRRSLGIAPLDNTASTALSALLSRQPQQAGNFYPTSYGFGAVDPRSKGAWLPSPDFISANPQYAAQTRTLAQLRQPVAGANQPPAPQTLTPMLPAAVQTPYSPAPPAGSPGAGYASFQGQRPAMSGTLGYAGSAETAGMNQRQATDYNVAGINRQIAALRDLHETKLAARGEGAGAAGVQAQPGIDYQDLARQSNPFYQPGQNYGDEVLNRDRYMRQFPGDTRRGLQLRQQAEIGLADIGNRRLSDLLDTANRQQLGQQGLQASLASSQQKALADQRSYGTDLQRIGLDRGRLQFEKDRAGQTDALNLQRIGLDRGRLQFEIDRARQTDALNQRTGNAAVLRDLAVARKSAQEQAGLFSEQSLLQALRQTTDPAARRQLLETLLAARGKQFDPALMDIQ